LIWQAKLKAQRRSVAHDFAWEEGLDQASLRSPWEKTDCGANNAQQERSI
jgi:hypothetical protein